MDIKIFIRLRIQNLQFNSQIVAYFKRYVRTFDDVRAIHYCTAREEAVCTYAHYTVCGLIRHYTTVEKDENDELIS